MSAKPAGKIRPDSRWVIIPLLLSVALHLAGGGVLPDYLAGGHQQFEKEVSKRYQPMKIRSVRRATMTRRPETTGVAEKVEDTKIELEDLIDDLPSGIPDIPGSTQTPDVDTEAPASRSRVRKLWAGEKHRLVIREGEPQLSQDTTGEGDRYGYSSLSVFDDQVKRITYASGKGSGKGKDLRGTDKEISVDSLLTDSYAPEPDLSPQKLTSIDAGGTVRKDEPDVSSFAIAVTDDRPGKQESLAEEVRQAKLPEPKIEEAEKPKNDPGNELSKTPPVILFDPGGATPFENVQPLQPNVETDFQVFREPGSPKSFFKLTIRAKQGARLPIIRKNILFVIDISLSVPKEELEGARKAVRTYLAQIHPDDKFNVIRFSEEFDRAFPAFVLPTPENIEKGLNFINKVPGQVKTDVYGVLHSIILSTFSRDKPCHVFLITDGKSTHGIRDTQRIVRDIAPVIKSNISIFPVDIGEGGNRYLLDLVGYRSRGELLDIDQLEDVEEGFVKFASQKDRPLLMNLSVNYANLKVGEIYPQILPNLYQKKGVVIYGQCEPGRECAIQIYGQSAGEKWKRFLYPIKIPEGTGGDPTIARDWARGKIHFLVAKLAREGEKPELIEEIKGLGHKYDLPIPFEEE